MKKQEIFEKFKIIHSELFRKNTEIWISETIDEHHLVKTNKLKPIDLLEIHVNHPFVYDNRLVPKKFMGVKVSNGIIGKFPNEFPSQNATLPIFEWFSPNNYKRFVSNNILKLRKEFNNAKLTETEALNALMQSGTFIEHEKKCIKMKNDIVLKSKDDIIFFNTLLKKTGKAFSKSDISKHSNNNSWGYSVTATMFMKNKPLIVGFNWGVDSKWLNEGNVYNEQKEYPLRQFESNYDDLGSFKRVVNYFHRFFPKALSGMQSNFCFFRSEKDSQISKNDLNMCKPLFDELLEYSNPSMIISFSSRLRDYFVNNSLLTDPKVKTIDTGNGKLKLIKGNYELSTGKKIKFLYLPHPNYPLKSKYRDEAWEFEFTEI